MCDGVDLEGTSYNNLRYADDTALIADSEEELQRLLKGKLLQRKVRDLV